MDLKQNKLSKTEWESIEKSVDDDEKKILKLIVDGYTDVNARYNETQSLNNHIRFDSTNEMDYFLYKKYFEQLMTSVINKYAFSYCSSLENIIIPINIEIIGPLSFRHCTNLKDVWIVPTFTKSRVRENESCWFF